MNKVKIKDIVDIYNGSTPSTSISENFDGNISWITPKDISDQKSKYIYRGERNITEKGLKSIGGSLLPKGTILFSSRAPIGLMSISKVETSTNQGFKNMVCKKGKVHNEYLYYLLKTQIAKIQELGTGTTFKEVSKSTIENFELYIVEDLPTQQKIAAVLSALDDKIELNNTINAELEAMAKTLYDYWFVQFEFPNSEGKPYKSSGGAMEYNSILKREIPKGWEVKTIGDYCKSTGGFAFKSSWWTNEGEAVIKIKDIQEDYTINLDDLSYVDLSDKIVDDKFKAKPGDVLIAMTGATIGKYAIVPITEKPLYVNQRVGYFNLGEKPIFKLPFFINSLNQSYFRETVFALASGAAQPNISNEQINNISLLFPEEEFIKMYNSKLYGCYKRILLNLKQNQELAQLRDWLLPMLMNGQVKVVDAEEQAMSIAAEPNITYAKRSEKNKDDSKEE